MTKKKEKVKKKLTMFQSLDLIEYDDY